MQKLESLFLDDNKADTIEDEKEIVYTAYKEEDFISEVFMGREQYRSLVNLLENKKNIILQGAPGVGKTIAARRLAYSMMGDNIGEFFAAILSKGIANQVKRGLGREYICNTNSLSSPRGKIKSNGLLKAKGPFEEATGM